MLDSGPKQPENRIHLYDPVGLITDGYGGYRPSNYTVMPRRQTVSFNNFVEPTNNNNGLGLRSYNSVPDAHSTAGLKSYDSFEVESFTIRSFNDNISSETIDDDSTSMVSDRADGGLRFVTAEKDIEDDQLDAPTPRLWRPSSATSPKSLRSIQSHNTTPTPVVIVNSPTKSVNFAQSQPTSPKSVNSNTSPLNSLPMSANSRTQAIAKGRRELMDMVRDLPESFYELSLKDIVEQKAVEMETKKEIDIPEEKKAVNEMNTSKNQKETKKQKKSSKKVSKSESKKKMVRSRSVDNGKFLLKTSVFPILGSRKSKKSLNAASSFKVAPMPKEQTSNGPVKAGEKEWWRRKSCMSSESDQSNGLSSQSMSSRSSSSSSRSNSSNGRRGSRFLPSCCIFNGKRVEEKR